MKIVVTGSNGFIGKNLMLHLGAQDSYEPLGYTREHSIVDLANLIEQADAVVHLAGINRPLDLKDFEDAKYFPLPLLIVNIDILLYKYFIKYLFYYYHYHYVITVTLVHMKQYRIYIVSKTFNLYFLDIFK